MAVTENTLILETPQGPVTIEMRPDLAPGHVARIKELVRDGFYANRADLIRTAVRNQLERHDESVRQSVARRQLKLGLTHYARKDLEAARDAGAAKVVVVDSPDRRLESCNAKRSSCEEDGCTRSASQAARPGQG